MQDCQQKRSRDNLVENILTTINSHSGIKGRKENVSLALSMTLQPSFCKYVIWPLALALLDRDLATF